MNVLVSGGTGYLGSRVIIRLVNENHNIICATQPGEKLDNLISVIDKIIIIDVPSVNDYLNKHKIDWILNFAGVYEKKGISLSTIVNCNTIFALQMLNIAVEHKIKNFLTIDTSLPDDFNLYSFTKKKFAEFGKFYCDTYSINFINLLLEMFYGPKEPKNRFLPMCIEKLRNNEELPLTEGKQKRDIIHVDDICGAIIAILNSNLIGYQAIPVGTGEGPCVRTIIEHLHTILQSSSELKFGQIPMRSNEPDSIADITMLNKIGFQCKYDWKKGLYNLVFEEE